MSSPRPVRPHERVELFTSLSYCATFAHALRGAGSDENRSKNCSKNHDRVTKRIQGGLMEGSAGQQPAKRQSSAEYTKLREPFVRISILAALVLGGLAIPDLAQQPELPVGIVLAHRAPIAKTAEFVGRVEAIERVDIRARVTGFLESVDFKEGDAVKEGAPLYRIEKDQFKAAVEQARGALERDKAAKTLAEIDLQRAQELMNKGSGTVVARDKARAADEQSQGSLIADQANLETAQINLRYTDILAPISGKVGKTNVTKGNVVGPDSGVLTMIVSQDPMRVAFPVSQREFLRAKTGEHGGKRGSFKVQLHFSDGQA